MPIDLSTLVAGKGFAPRAWQSTAPVESYLGRKPAITDSKELRRIVALPRRDPPPGAAVVEYMTRRFARHNPNCQCQAKFKRPCITRLLDVQAWALYEIACEGGLLGPIGVGHGKTMLDLLAALAMPDCKQALLLAPSNLMGQLAVNYDHYSQHFYMPRIVIMGASVFKSLDGPHIKPDAPVLHVLPYSRLQRPTATVFIDTLSPDAIFSDECHKLAADSATRGRVMRYMDAQLKVGRIVRFCGWTGSMTYKSPEDYAHIVAWALRERSPLPLDKQVVKEWATAFDGDWPAPMGALSQLCHPGEHVYSGFKRRVLETAGVVSTTEAAIDAELKITERVAPPIPETPSPFEGYHKGKSVQECLRMIRDESIRPDGDTLLDAFAQNRCAREMACGFFYYWYFPPIHGVPQRKEHIDAWYAARKAWHIEVRDLLKDRKEHLDSPFLCACAAARYWGDTVVSDEYTTGKPKDVVIDTSTSLPKWESNAWCAWRDIRKTVVHESRPQWVDDYLARDAAQWAQENRGIVWYEHNAFGVKVGELSGLPVHGGGPGAEQRLIGGKHGNVTYPGEDGSRSIICSIKSHGTGRDGLQFLYDRQLVANPMSNPTGWEQLLGRLFRIGQKSPCVYTEFYRHTDELRAHVDMAIKRAIYVQGTLGASQKLLAGFVE